jgi:hypothetical protein
MFCRHEWALLSETTTKSRIEVTMEALSKTNLTKFQVTEESMDASRKIIQIVTCTKCGKLKKFITKI